MTARILSWVFIGLGMLFTFLNSAIALIIFPFGFFYDFLEWRSEKKKEIDKPENPEERYTK
jgi:hypothetical protein